MRALPIAMVLVALAGGTAAADRELCTSNAKFRGKTVDLDVKSADLHEVFRLLADVGKVNLVVPETISGKVTLKLKRVPWDQIVCVVAAVHKLKVTVQDSILMVSKR